MISLLLILTIAPAFYGDIAQPGRASAETTDTFNNCTTPTNSNSFSAAYYNNPDLSGQPIAQRTEDPHADQANSWFFVKDWGYGGPWRDGVRGEDFSAAWTGCLYLTQGVYYMRAIGDDGMKVVMDWNNIVLQDWDSPRPGNLIGNYYRVAPSEAGYHMVRIYFYEHSGLAFVKVGMVRTGDNDNYGGGDNGTNYRCSGSSLSNSFTIQGRIDSNTPTRTYCFSGSRWQDITVRLFAIGNSELDTVLDIYAPDGTLITQNDDGDGIGYNSFVKLTLQQAGTYTLSVSSYGSTSGIYRMRIDNGRKASAGDVNSDCVVNQADVDMIRSSYGSTNNAAVDVDLDGVVTTRDNIFALRQIGLRCN